MRCSGLLKYIGNPIYDVHLRLTLEGVFEDLDNPNTEGLIRIKLRHNCLTQHFVKCMYNDENVIENVGVHYVMQVSDGLLPTLLCSLKESRALH